MIVNQVKRRLLPFVYLSALLLGAIWIYLRYGDVSHYAAKAASHFGSSGAADEKPVVTQSPSSTPTPSAGSEYSRPGSGIYASQHPYPLTETTATPAQAAQPTWPAGHVGAAPANDGESEDAHGNLPEGGSKEGGLVEGSPAENAIEPPLPPPTGMSHQELLGKARTFLPSILNPDDTSIDRMSCPAINETRYGYLRVAPNETKYKYFFALNLRQCVDLLPRLLGSIVEAIRFLGPHNCALSIVEGNSDDGTGEVLDLLRTDLEMLGIKYYIQHTPLNPSEDQRIQRLALLRAHALAPLTGTNWTTPEDNEAASPAHKAAAAAVAASTPGKTRRRGLEALASYWKSVTGSTDPQPRLDLTDDAAVLFVNDVAACAEDLLELLHQRRVQDADMTCAMDWTHPGADPIFYDVWVSRALNGDFFFDIPPEVSWDRAADLFWNEPVAAARLAAARRPFQVFACWNGAVAFAAGPVARGEVGFRAPREGECFQGEPQLFCKDMWFRGHGRIAVVPSVNLEYTDAKGRLVKQQLGFASDWAAREADPAHAGVPLRIPWQRDPPEKVKCAPGFQWQSWLPWNESLV